jgi:hypothetical protein
MPDDGAAGELRGYYRGLMDPHPPPPDAECRVASRVAYPHMRQKLAALFQENPAAKGILIVVGDHEVGVATPESVRDPGHAGIETGAEVGVGDRASHPGESTRYRALRFRCRKSCPTVVVLSFYDERLIPECDRHGPLTLHREDQH